MSAHSVVVFGLGVEPGEGVLRVLGVVVACVVAVLAPVRRVLAPYALQDRRAVGGYADVVDDYVLALLHVGRPYAYGLVRVGKAVYLVGQVHHVALGEVVGVNVRHRFPAGIGKAVYVDYSPRVRRVFIVGDELQVEVHRLVRRAVLGRGQRVASAQYERRRAVGACACGRLRRSSSPAFLRSGEVFEVLGEGSVRVGGVDLLVQVDIVVERLAQRLPCYGEAVGLEVGYAYHLRRGEERRGRRYLDVVDEYRALGVEAYEAVVVGRVVVEVQFDFRPPLAFVQARRVISGAVLEVGVGYFVVKVSALAHLYADARAGRLVPKLFARVGVFAVDLPVGHGLGLERNGKLARIVAERRHQGCRIHRVGGFQVDHSAGGVGELARPCAVLGERGVDVYARLVVRRGEVRRCVGLLLRAPCDAREVLVYEYVALGRARLAGPCLERRRRNGRLGAVQNYVLFRLLHAYYALRAVGLNRRTHRGKQ